MAIGAYQKGAYQPYPAYQQLLVEVPDVVGQSQAAGTAILEGVGFVVGVQTDYSPSVAVGDIISESPVAGTMAAEGSTVYIVVSLGPSAGGADDTLIRFGRRRGRGR